MFSDDSAAFEVESDVDEFFEDKESEFASEIADSIDSRETASMPTRQQNKMSKPEATDIHLKAENDYSADEFDDEFEEYEDETRVIEAPASRHSSTTKTSSPTYLIESSTRCSIDVFGGAYDDDYEYDEASFEEDSRRSQSQRSISQSRSLANSPESNMHFIQKTSKLLPETRLPVSGGKTFVGPRSQVLASDGEEKIGTMQTKQISLLLRKVESKYKDEIKELREKNALLLLKGREIKATMRQTKEELTMRKARMEKKRRRAADRRREHERAAERVQQELASALSSNVECDRRVEGLQGELIEVRGVLKIVEQQRQEAEVRTMNLAEKLQISLKDFHQLTSNFESTVNAKRACEQRFEEVKGMHQVQLEVMEHKCKVDIDAARQALAEEVAARANERQTLPENYKRVVDAERERFERLEAVLIKQMHELESRAAQNKLTHSAELARANEAKHQAEQQAERRIHNEVDRIAREREALDEQRRELLVSMARSNAHIDEERGKMEARTRDLDARWSEFAAERAELKVRIECIEERQRRLENSEMLIERRRTELAAVGRETLERSYALARRAQEFVDIIAERDKLRCLVKGLTERSERSEQRALALERDREMLKTAANELEQERLVVAKQRVQSRYFLDGARKLESVLQPKYSTVTDKVHPKTNFNI